MKNIYSFLVLLLLMSSCSKFLEEYSTDQRYATTAEDLDYLMIGEGFINSVFSLSVYSHSTMSSLEREDNITMPWLHVMDDDCEKFVVDYVSTDQATPLYMLSGFHDWKQSPCIDVLNKTWEDVAWRKIYKHIGALNSIIFQAEQLANTVSDTELLNHVWGEAYFLRAYYYFTLQNVYGSPYSVSTANSDEGVPLKISEKIEDNYFSRSKNKAVYDQIIADLDQAAYYLSGYNPSTKIRVGIAAVRALQSRVYLYTEQYDDVITAADSLEAMGEYTLEDLNQYVENTNFTYRSSPGTIFTMGSNEIPLLFINDSLSAWGGADNRASAFKASDDLISQYDANDLRRNACFIRSAKQQAWLPAKYRTSETYNDPEEISCTFSIRYAEVILNRAEALAMKGSDGDARIELQKLREKRFLQANIADLPQSNEDLVNFIRAERRRELCFEGQRWFDLRRYAVNSKYPLPGDFTIHHPSYTYDANTNTHTQTGNYELKAITQDAAAWQVPIPDYAIEFNRGALTNPVRNVRNVIPL